MAFSPSDKANSLTNCSHIGAYLSTAYALRHPNRVSRLILLSPAGVPEDPDLTVSAEVDPSPETALNSTNGDSNTNGTASKAQVRDVKKEQAERRKNQSNFRKAATFLWESGFSPFQIVRSTLFYGPMLVGKYSSRRFPHLPQEDVVDMHEYIWHITRAKGSGEYGLCESFSFK
jgi:cardiolipin-specific phospholipase